MDENRQPSNTHPLLDLASTAPRNDAITIPEEVVYDLRVGAWVLNGTDRLYVELPDRPFMTTKKKDIETGEDHKGT